VTLEQEWEALSAMERPEVPEMASGVDLALLAADTADCLRVLFMTGSLDPGRIGALRAASLTFARHSRPCPDRPPPTLRGSPR
jgi:hypothetical protein